MARNSESTKKAIILYLDKRSLKYQDDEKIKGIVLGFSSTADQDIKFKLAISIQENGDFIQFFSTLKLKPNCNEIQKRLLNENLTKKLIKWTILQEGKAAICFVDILIDENEEISHTKIDRALKTIQNSITSLTDLFLFE